MSKQTEALKLALEALESYTPGDYSTGHVIHPSCDEDAVIKAITALREALEQPAIPKGWKLVPVELTPEMEIAANNARCNYKAEYRAMLNAAPTPPQQAPEPEQPAQQQEPYGWIGRDSGAFIKNVGQKNVQGTPLYTRPQAREWVGLTDAEFQWIYDNGRTPAGMVEMAEAKLKEKNT